jgi:hypothetical protein
MQFQKGQTGQPASPPRRSRNLASIRMEDMLDALVAKVVELGLKERLARLKRAGGKRLEPRADT